MSSTKQDWWKEYCWNKSGIDEENLDEIEAGLMNRILLNESGTFYKIIIVFCAELSETNCRAELSNAEMSAPNCPAPNCPGTVFQEKPFHTSHPARQTPHQSDIILHLDSSCLIYCFGLLFQNYPTHLHCCPYSPAMSESSQYILIWPS